MDFIICHLDAQGVQSSVIMRDVEAYQAEALVARLKEAHPGLTYWSEPVTK